MKVVFAAQTGCFSGLIAALYWSEKLSKESTIKEIYDLLLVGQHMDLTQGNILFLGKDQNDNELFSMGTGAEASLVLISWEDLCRIIGEDIKDEVKLINVSAMDTIFLRILWYFSRYSLLRKAILFTTACIFKLQLAEF